MFSATYGSLSNSGLVSLSKVFLVSSQKREAWEGVLLIPRARKLRH